MIITVIPARLGSTRLPNKLILADTGRPLLHYTIDRALESRLSSMVFVVTPDKEILEVVRNYNHPKVQSILTGHANSGTERLAKFCLSHFMDDGHIVVNLQGDEPSLPGLHIDQVVEAISAGLYDVATLASPIGAAEALDNNIVKVVMSHTSTAMWFSRCPIPVGGPWYKHVGVYAYKVGFLRKLPLMVPTTVGGEHLEQLQWLQSGYKIRVCVDQVDSEGIDTHENYAAFTQKIKADTNRAAVAIKSRKASVKYDRSKLLIDLEKVLSPVCLPSDDMVEMLIEGRERMDAATRVAEFVRDAISHGRLKEK